MKYLRILVIERNPLGFIGNQERIDIPNAKTDERKWSEGWDKDETHLKRWKKEI